MTDGVVGLKIIWFNTCLTTSNWCIILSWIAWVFMFHCP